MIAGYHTAGLLLHDLVTSINELAHLGYSSVAIRPHAGMFHPDLPNFSTQIVRLTDAISRTGIRLVIDLDAMYLRDPFTRLGPSLTSADDPINESARRWIERWIGIADEIGASLVTFASGAGEISDFFSDEEQLERLTDQLHQIDAATAGCKTALAIRPRAGDLIGSVVHFERLQRWLGDLPIGLAADIGEMLAAGELPVSDRLMRNLEALKCVYLCDKRSGIAGDQRIGAGDVALHRIVGTLRRSGFAGPGIVRIEGHSEWGLEPAREAIAIFDP